MRRRVSLGTLVVLAVGRVFASGDPDATELSALKRLSIDELMRVEVTSASRRPEPLGGTTLAIDVISGEDIRRSGAATLPEALRSAGNLQVARKNAHDWGVTARGFNTDLANKMLVLVDGRSVYTPLFSGVFWDLQDMVLPDVDRIEVINGPGGTMWGANAVNGVINIISRSSKETLGDLLQAGIGPDERFAAARYGARVNRDVTFRVYGKYTAHDAENLDRGGDAGDGWQMRRAGFRLDAERGGTLTLQGDYYDGSASGGGAGAGRMNGGNLRARWSRPLANDTQADLQVYGDRAYLAQPATAAGAGLTDDERRIDIDFQHRNTGMARQHWVWGLGCRITRDTVGNTAALSFEPADTTLKLFSAFAQDEIDFGPLWALTFGTKLEHNDYTGYEYEPSVRVRFTPAHNQTVWAAISRAVRTPSRVDRDLRQPGMPPTILSGNPAFESETLVAYELGYRRQLGARASLAVSGFFNNYDNLRSLGITPVTIVPLVFQNNLQGHTYGGELNATFDVLENWQVRAAYNYLAEELEPKPGQLDLNHGLNETADPRRQFSLRSLLDLPDGWELDGAFRWVDSFVTNNGGQPSVLPAYAEVDLRLGWRISTALELSVSGRNLLHPAHVEYGAAPAGRVALARSVLATATWRF